MTRKQALIAIRAAGAENDQKTFLRVYTENRISYAIAKEAFDQGRSFSANLGEGGQFNLHPRRGAWPSAA